MNNQHALLYFTRSKYNDAFIQFPAYKQNADEECIVPPKLLDSMFNFTSGHWVAMSFVLDFWFDSAVSNSFLCALLLSHTPMRY
jgi:hypothetical protein